MQVVAGSSSSSDTHPVLMGGKTCSTCVICRSMDELLSRNTSLMCMLPRQAREQHVPVQNAAAWSLCGRSLSLHRLVRVLVHRDSFRTKEKQGPSRLLHRTCIAPVGGSAANT